MDNVQDLSYFASMVSTFCLFTDSELQALSAALKLASSDGVPDMLPEGTDTATIDALYAASVEALAIDPEPIHDPWESACYDEPPF